MRKDVTILGIGQRKAGIAKKTGSKFDFSEVAIGYELDGFAGMKCETVPFDTALIADYKERTKNDFVVGSVVDLVFHQSNFKTYVDAIL